MIRYSMLSMLDCEAPDDQVRLSNLGTLGDGGRGHSGRRLPHPGRLLHLVLQWLDRPTSRADTEPFQRSRCLHNWRK
jgi:hypothetical protein